MLASGLMAGLTLALLILGIAYFLQACFGTYGDFCTLCGIEVTVLAGRPNEPKYLFRRKGHSFYSDSPSYRFDLREGPRWDELVNAARSVDGDDEVEPPTVEGCYAFKSHGIFAYRFPAADPPFFAMTASEILRIQALVEDAIPLTPYRTVLRGAAIGMKRPPPPVRIARPSGANP